MPLQLLQEAKDWEIPLAAFEELICRGYSHLQHNFKFETDRNSFCKWILQLRLVGQTKAFWSHTTTRWSPQQGCWALLFTLTLTSACGHWP